VRGHIGRANLDGSGVDQAFTPVLWNEDRTVPEATFGITVAGDHIWRARLNGSHVKRHFIKVTGGPTGLAVR
jgi:hypothetical protein